MISGRFRAHRAISRAVGRSILFPMAKGKKAAVPKKQLSLAAHNFLPTLTKPGEIVGEYIVGEYGNCKLFTPPKDAILQRYLRKFSKHGKLLDADLGLIMVGEGHAGSSEAHAQLPAPTT